jgi:hypothetical protein
MTGISQKIKSPFFVSMATAAKFLQPIPICFCLSRSARCGCSSYQVSSISYITTKISLCLLKGNQFFFKSPLFCFHGNCDKVCPTDSGFFLAYLVPLDVDVTGYITAKICEV